MNTTAITLLRNVINSPVTTGKLKEILGIKDWQFQRACKEAHTRGIYQKGCKPDSSAR